MKKIKRLLFFAMIVLPAVSFAEIYINEIDYNAKSTDNDWVELYNSGPDPVTITTGSGSNSWRIVDSSNHTLTLISGDATIAAGEYAVIVTDSTKFVSDWSSFSGTLFKSSAFSLSNTSGHIGIKSSSSGAELDHYDYSKSQGANGDGNSLQRQADGSWIAAAPTPGAANSSVAATVSDDSQNASSTADTDTDFTDSGTDNSDTTSSAYSSIAEMFDGKTPVNFQISAGRDRLTSVGSDLLFVAKPVKTQGVLLSMIGYNWSFGDGTVGQGVFAHHSYKFAGDYTVVLNAKSADDVAVDKINVRVVEPKVTLQKVEGGVEIKNNSGAEINLGGWKLKSGDRVFVFPDDTLLPNAKKLTFADDVTGENNGDLHITNPQGVEYAQTVFVIPDISVSATSSVDFEKLSAGVSAVKQKLADLQFEISQQNFSEISQTPVVATDVSQSAPQTKNTFLPTKEQSVFLSQKIIKPASTSTQTESQVATVFVASSSPGFVSRVFSWPIRGFNFLHSLFEEK